jgi:hypothetical protein
LTFLANNDGENIAATNDDKPDDFSASDLSGGAFDKQSGGAALTVIGKRETAGADVAIAPEVIALASVWEKMPDAIKTAVMGLLAPYLPR